MAEQIQDPWGGGCLSISGAENEKVREWYAERNMSVFAYSSLARGLLSGKMKSSESAEASRFFDRPAVLGYCHPRNFERLKKVEYLAGKKGYGTAQIALAWLLNQNVNTFPIVGCRTSARLEENAAALQIRLTSNELQWLDLQTSELEERTLNT